jgi:hypothetical protein
MHASVCLILALLAVFMLCASALVFVIAARAWKENARESEQGLGNQAGGPGAEPDDDGWSDEDDEWDDDKDDAEWTDEDDEWDDEDDGPPWDDDDPEAVRILSPASGTDTLVLSSETLHGGGHVDPAPAAGDGAAVQGGDGRAQEALGPPAAGPHPGRGVVPQPAREAQDLGIRPTPRGLTGEGKPGRPCGSAEPTTHGLPAEEKDRLVNLVMDAGERCGFAVHGVMVTLITPWSSEPRVEMFSTLPKDDQIRVLSRLLEGVTRPAA